MTAAADDHSARLRQLEQISAAVQVRLGALERMSERVETMIEELRSERREDSQRIFASIEALRTDVAQHIGMRKAFAWMVGVALALVAALIGAWNAWKASP